MHHRTFHGAHWFGLAVLVAAVVIAFANGLPAAFVFDDGPNIAENTALHRLWPLSELLRDPADLGSTLSGRPAVSLSLALNYALAGGSAWSYRAGNIVIHALASLVLFGLVRRTLALPALRDLGWLEPTRAAFAASALWALHPLQTASVTYIVQRAESQAGLFYLLTLYCFARSLDSGRSRLWQVASVAVCLAGMATKEVMATAPLLVWLYDRTFAAGSFSAAWVARRRFYLGLAACWLLLLALVASSESRGGTAGFDTDVSPWTYALTQFEAIVRYLRLAFWPYPLVFDYGTAVAPGLGAVWLEAVVVLSLFAGIVLALRRSPRSGFAGVWFFALLAPSSSFVPIVSQTMAEHRVYLALAAPVALAVLGMQRALGRRAWPLWLGLALACGALTTSRNHDYRTELSLWSDTASKRPQNPRAHINLARVLLDAGRTDEALSHLQQALRLDSRSADARFNLGVALARQGRDDEAHAAYDEALRLRPNYSEAANNLGNLHLAAGRSRNAEQAYRQALASRPNYAEAHSNLSIALLEQGRTTEAIRSAEEALRLRRRFAEAAYNLGNAFIAAGRFPAALDSLQRAVEWNPAHAEAHSNLANVLVELDRLPDAVPHYEAAVRLKPGFVAPRRTVAALLVHLGRLPQALEHYEELARHLPGDATIMTERARLRAAINAR